MATLEPQAHALKLMHADSLLDTRASFVGLTAAEEGEEQERMTNPQAHMHLPDALAAIMGVAKPGRGGLGWAGLGCCCFLVAE